MMMCCGSGVADGEEEQQQQGQISPAQTKLYASKWTLVSRLSSRLAGAQSAQAAQAGSASEQSTPSNLERAVLLLEAETESVSSDSKVSAATSAVSSPSQPAGGIEAEAGDSNSSAASARGPEQGASIAAGVKAQPAEHKEVLSDRASSADLEAHRTALRRLDVAGSQGGSAGGSDSLDEGPCTPPASSAAARADTKASSSPNSTAGEPRISLSTECCAYPLGKPGGEWLLVESLQLLSVVSGRRQRHSDLCSRGVKKSRHAETRRRYIPVGGISDQEVLHCR